MRESTAVRQGLAPVARIVATRCMRRRPSSHTAPVGAIQKVLAAPAGRRAMWTCGR